LAESVKLRNTLAPAVVAVEVTLSDPPTPVAAASAFWPFAVVAVADAVALPCAVLLPLKPPVAVANASAVDPAANPVAVDAAVA
jgi:hypothetical protein